MPSSFAQRVLKSESPVILFHTWTVTRELLSRAISENRSMDLDVCVDDNGAPYLGHSREFHEKTYSPFFDSMPLWEAVELIAHSTIPVIVDCKHHAAWRVVEEVVARIGQERCLVHSFVSELKFDASRFEGEPDFQTEWSPMETLRSFKERFPLVTTTASAKWLPFDVLLSERHRALLSRIRQLLKDNLVDTVCVNVRDDTFSDNSLRYFLEEGIIPHLGVDKIDLTQLTEVYIGESDRLESTTIGKLW